MGNAIEDQRDGNLLGQPIQRGSRLAVPARKDFASADTGRQEMSAVRQIHAAP